MLSVVAFVISFASLVGASSVVKFTATEVKSSVLLYVEFATSCVVTTGVVLLGVVEPDQNVRNPITKRSYTIFMACAGNTEPRNNLCAERRVWSGRLGLEIATSALWCSASLQKQQR